MKSLFWSLILIIIFIHFTLFLLAYRHFFLKRFDSVYISRLYSDSQYVVGSGSQGIGDDGLYAFAGYFYLFQGGDISAVNFEHPPLGKYLIGLSILLFHNENIINIFYFVLILFLTYKLGQLILEDKLKSILASAVIAFEPLFLDNLIRSLLDLPFTLFFVAAVYFWIKSLKQHKFFFVSFFFWGCAFSTRFFPFMVIIYLFLLFLIMVHNRNYLFIFLISSLLVPIVYFITHISFFFYHPSIIEFLRHKKWMLSWYMGSPKVFGNVLRNIFTGQYINATGELVTNQYWTIILPAVVLLALISFKMTMLKKTQIKLLVIYGLSLIYLVYLNSLTLGLGKFLMPIYPLLVILAVSRLSSWYSIITPWKS